MPKEKYDRNAVNELRTAAHRAMEDLDRLGAEYHNLLPTEDRFSFRGDVERIADGLYAALEDFQIAHTTFGGK